MTLKIKYFINIFSVLAFFLEEGFSKLLNFTLLIFLALDIYFLYELVKVFVNLFYLKSLLKWFELQ